MKKSEKIDALKKLKAFVKSDKFGKGVFQEWGLCASANYISGGLFSNQYVYLRKLIRKQKRMPNSSYCWKQGVKAPRIRFIDRELKKLGVTQ